MVTIYRDYPFSGYHRTTDNIFAEYERLIDKTDPVFKDILMYIENAEWDGKFIKTRYGTGSLGELQIATKLALLMWTMWTGYYETTGCSHKQLSKLLRLPCGQLIVKLDRPLPFYFECGAITEDGIMIRNSADLNLWYFK